MKKEIPYMALIGSSLAVTAIIFFSMEILINDLKLGNLGNFLTVGIAMGTIYLQNLLIARSLTT